MRTIQKKIVDNNKSERPKMLKEEKIIYQCFDTTNRILYISLAMGPGE